MPTDSISRVAYHECGHAVAAVWLGGGIEVLTIDPEPDNELPNRSGEIQVVWPEALTEQEIGVREIKVSLAGPVAEMIYDGNQYDPEFLEEWRCDWLFAVDRAIEFLPQNKPVAEHLAGYVHQLLGFFERDDVWAALAALADELEAFETLEPNQIEDVLRAWPVFL